MHGPLHIFSGMGGLCSSTADEMLKDMQHHCDEQTEIIETIIEVEEEDKSHIRTLKKEVEVLDILLDQYENATKSLGDLLPAETQATLRKLSSKRIRLTEDRRQRAKRLNMEMDEHVSLVRPSDEKIKKAQSKAAAKKVWDAHEEGSKVKVQKLEKRRQKARERVQTRLHSRNSIHNGKKPALSLSPLPDSVRRHPSFTGSKSPKNKVKPAAQVTEI